MIISIMIFGSIGVWFFGTLGRVLGVFDKNASPILKVIYILAWIIAVFFIVKGIQKAEENPLKEYLPKKESTY